MPLVQVSPAMLPGEAAIVALANLFTELAKDLGADEKNKLAARFLEVTAPYHALNVVLAQNVSRFVANLLHIQVSELAVPSAIQESKTT